MSTKKIEGYGNEATESWSVNHPTGSRATWLPATLIIHSGEPEPVYTQSEVVKLALDMKIEALRAYNALQDWYLGKGSRPDSPGTKLDSAAAKHGITL